MTQEVDDPEHDEDHYGPTLDASFGGHACLSSRLPIALPIQEEPWPSPNVGDITHPALVEIAEERARSVQNRIADVVTRFARSMWFVYLHIAWFSVPAGAGGVAIIAPALE